ncbi:MAG: molybdopterin molybdotransferase MoeA [Candidatus Nezhaarchaeota archaeon]|nr:molybdopterin molybdotransferase MoeA [Candidatus Nezhaarchaeota archaeon]
MSGSFIDEVIKVDDAIRLAASLLKVPSREVEVPLQEAAGLIASRSISAPYDMPLYDRSAVDGYAVHAEDTYGASLHGAAELKVVGRVTSSTSIEEVSKTSLKLSEAVEILTGGPLPPGADAVVMYEDVTRMNDKIYVHRALPRWANVSRRGEDFKEGETIVEKGVLLAPWHLAALAAFGFSRVHVYDKLKVGILATGGELAEPLQPVPLRKGVYNSTSTMIMSCLSGRRFIEAVYLGRVMDDVERIAEGIEGAFRAGFDAVVTTGGTGVSGDDVTTRAVERVGTIAVRGVAIRPGRPTSIGVVEGKPVFMLSGFPVAALVALEFVVLPVIYRLFGSTPQPKPIVKAKLTRRLANVVGHRSYVRAKVFRRNGELIVEPLRLTGSGVLSTLVKGNGIIEVPEGLEGYEPGEEVNVILIGGLEGM